jgi:hypothetical protein
VAKESITETRKRKKRRRKRKKARKMKMAITNKLVPGQFSSL